MVSNVGGNGNNFFKNIDFNRDGKVDAQDERIGQQLTNTDLNNDGKVDAQDHKILQNAIQTNQLEALLSQLGNDIKATMGLNIANTQSQGAEEIKDAALSTVDKVKFEDGVDLTKIKTYITNANINRIEGFSDEAFENLDNGLNGATRSTAEDLFASGSFATLDKLFGIA